MTRTAATSPSRALAELAAASATADWRSHTFGDGVRSLTLLGPLDVGLADRLCTRVSELVERGCRQLIVDASAIEPAGEQPALLATVFAGQPASFRAVVIAPPGSTLVDLLPAPVGVALTLSDAHRELRAGTARAGRVPVAAEGRGAVVRRT
jgi:hypothetical protein